MATPGMGVEYSACGLLREISERGLLSNDGKLLEEKIGASDESSPLGTLALLDLIGRRCPIGGDLLAARQELISDLNVEFEYELEKERRVVVQVDEGLLGEPQKWENTFYDTYDQSGRFRVREKNGKLRASIKIPLFYEIDPIRKHCIRIELKPHSSETEGNLREIREILRKESGIQEFKKYGRRINLTNGREVWINANDQGEYWIDSDEDGGSEDIVDYLPDGIIYLRDELSKVEIHQNVIMNNYKEYFLANLTKTSRIASGNVDTSVASEKKGVMRDNEDAALIVAANENKVFDYLWKNKIRHFDNPISVLSFVDEIATLVNADLVEVPNAWRTWDVKYGRGIKATELGREMMVFAAEFVERFSQLNDEKDIVEFAGWIELQLDRHLHAYVDGCGRITKAVSSWLLMSKGLPLPDYVDRKLYYGAMNEGDEAFQEYFSHAYNRGKETWKTS